MFFLLCQSPFFVRKWFVFQQLGPRKNPVDGSSFNIVVPPGMGPGSILQVQPAPREAKPRDGGSGSLPDAAVCPTPHGSFREDTWAEDVFETCWNILKHFETYCFGRCVKMLTSWFGPGLQSALGWKTASLRRSSNRKSPAANVEAFHSFWAWFLFEPGIVYSCLVLHPIYDASLVNPSSDSLPIHLLQMNYKPFFPTHWFQWPQFKCLAAVSNRTLLSISIPPGVLPGQTIAVKVPDGRELHVTVPEGAGQEWKCDIFLLNEKHEKKGTRSVKTDQCLSYSWSMVGKSPMWCCQFAFSIGRWCN